MVPRVKLIRRDGEEQTNRKYLRGKLGKKIFLLYFKCKKQKTKKETEKLVEREKWEIIILSD